MTDVFAPEALAALETCLLQILTPHTEPLSEYELLKQLRERGYAGFTDLQFHEPMALFFSHFLLHHALYRLQNSLWQQQNAYLAISALCIQLQPYQAGEQVLSMPDALRAYYLDAANLAKMTGDQLDQLLGQFWQKFHAADDKQAALATLALCEPVDYATIRQRYRQLAMQHHPDRGGDTATLQTINKAMAVLTRYYRAFDAPSE